MKTGRKAHRLEIKRDKNNYVGNVRSRWAKNFGVEGFIDDEERRGINVIEDIPVMFSEDGGVICIPQHEETRNILATGKKGVGKSILVHSFGEQAWWLWGNNICIMNDIQQETYEWNNKQKNKEWIQNLNRINENPVPLPMIFIYPHTNSLGLDYIEKEKKINFLETTLPFSEIINNSEVYMELDKSATYFKKMRSDLVKCDSPGEVESKIRENLPGDKQSPIRIKIINKLYEIFEEEICHITNPEFPYRLECGDIRGNPFVVLLRLGVIPCFETYDLQYKQYQAEVISYHLERIYKAVQKDYFDGDVYVIFDELTHVCDDSNKNRVYESLVKIASRGRKEGIGLVGATQSYDRIPKKIQENTDYVFVFEHVNDDQVKAIKRDYNLGNYDLSEIKGLRELEVVAASKEKFVKYKEGEKEVIEGPVKGKIIPPMSNHYHRGQEEDE